MKLALLLLATTLYSQEVPDWIIRGILKVETRSVLMVDGEIVYVDKKRGSAGERGPFQMRRVAFDQVSLPGEQFWQIEKDPELAQKVAERYLIWLYGRSGSWGRAVEGYNAGPGKRSPTYLKLVQKHGKA